MPTTLSTPGVYIEELSLLPPSVAEVSTAIPAFVGYTEKSPPKEGAAPKAYRISSIREYETLFGGPYKTVVQVSRTAGSDTISNPAPGHTTYKLYYQVRSFFNNGGGVAYIVPVGAYTTAAGVPGTPDPTQLINGVNALKNEDEPTLLLVPEALDTSYNALLQHCKDQKDRFAILDVNLTRNDAGGLKTDDVESVRGRMTVALDYGAAYGPFLQVPLAVSDDYVRVEMNTDTDPGVDETKNLKDLLIDKVPARGADAATIAAINAENDLNRDPNRALYHTIKSRLASETIALAPSGTIAGVYARVDRERGVWKAPANVGLIGVLGPVLNISNEEQENLNVDSVSGKSINIIRSFPGKGTLVWGARTLDGNSNEWRYVNVRRLFIMVEESIQKATHFAVFEPNTASTWLKVKTMIESYLFGLWQRGALAGAKPEHAYYVQVGLNTTMTQQDILEGIMRVNVGIAAVRPAEFIVISFAHKLQES